VGLFIPFVVLPGIFVVSFSRPIILVALIITFGAAFLRPWYAGFALTLVVGVVSSAIDAWLVSSAHYPTIAFWTYLAAIVVNYLLTWVFISTGLSRKKKPASETPEKQNPRSKLRGSSDRQQ
jgi:hypothetical protein